MGIKFSAHTLSARRTDYFISKHNHLESIKNSILIKLQLCQILQHHHSQGAVLASDPKSACIKQSSQLNKIQNQCEKHHQVQNLVILEFHSYEKNAISPRNLINQVQGQMILSVRLAQGRARCLPTESREAETRNPYQPRQRKVRVLIRSAERCPSGRAVTGVYPSHSSFGKSVVIMDALTDGVDGIHRRIFRWLIIQSRRQATGPCSA